MTNQTLVKGGEAGHWEQTIYAFLAEKERRSGSMRTVQAYSRMLFQFFCPLGKPPDEVTSPDVFSYAHSIGLSSKKPSSVTSYHQGAVRNCRSHVAFPIRNAKWSSALPPYGT